MVEWSAGSIILRHVRTIWEFPKIRSGHFEYPNNKDYSILGSMLGSLYFGKLPYTDNITKYSSFPMCITTSIFIRNLFHAHQETLVKKVPDKIPNGLSLMYTHD